MSDQLQKSQSAAGSSKASQDLDEYNKKVEEIDKLISEGKRFSLAQSFEEAAEKYELAVKATTEYFGQFSVECFQPALNYAKMLIEVARIESLSLPVNPPIEGIDEETDEEGTEKRDGAEDTAKMDEGLEKDDGANEEKVGKGTEAEENVNGTNKAENDKDEEQNSGDPTLTKTSGEEGEESEEEDAAEPGEEEEESEPDDIQTAWEWLEIARKICKIQEESPYWLECTSDVLLTLGECMTVVDNFEKALAEFTEGLVIRQKIFSPNDRRIAEVLFFIGLTHANMKNFDKAAESYEEAKKVLQGAVEEKEKAGGMEGEEDNKFKDEIEELKKVIESVEESIKDARESALSRAHQKEAEKEILPTTTKLSSQTDESQAGTGEVNDLSAMVKRKPVKRPAEQLDKILEAEEKNGMKENDNAITNGIEKAAGTPTEPEEKRAKISPPTDPVPN